MDLTKLNSRDANVCEAYVVKKFKSFKGITYSKKKRRAKCEDYYVAAAAGPYGQEIINRVYPGIFGGEMFDSDHAEDREKTALAMKPEKIKIESGAFIGNKGKYKQRLVLLKAQLIRDRDTGAWQEGERFFETLKIKMDEVDEDICNSMQFVSEFSHECEAKIKSSVALSKSEASAEFDLMVGYRQEASLAFEARSTNWGQINAKLEESFRAGIWASGSAKAKLAGLGFSAEVQAAIAVGALLKIDGELTWTKGDAGIKLGGKAEAFGGARAEVSAGLSVSAKEGFKASIAAGAFAGLEFKAEGSCAFTYQGQNVASVTGSASVTFGVGASFAAEIKAPIFGPTSISIAGNLTVGIGSAAEVKVEIDFDQMALASSEGFRKVVYWRTMARGYEMTLINSDAKNLYYLNKCIKRLDQEIEEVASTITSYNNTPMEKRSLLM